MEVEVKLEVELRVSTRAARPGFNPVPMLMLSTLVSAFMPSIACVPRIGPPVGAVDELLPPTPQ